MDTILDALGSSSSDDQRPLPRRYPSPSQERRVNERNRIRISFIAAPFLGLGVAILLVVKSSPLVASGAAISRPATTRATTPSVVASATKATETNTTSAPTRVPTPATSQVSLPPSGTSRSVTPLATEPASVTSTTGVATTATATNVPTRATETPVSSPKTHVVEKGDTLYSIARRYGTSVDTLVTANGLGNKDNALRIGLSLTVPVP